MLPATVRLRDALAEASGTTRNISTTIHTAEEKAAGLFTGQAEPPPAEAGEEAAPPSWWDQWGEWVHGGLDVAGFVPIIGEVADGLNALIYLGEGRHVEAGISAAAMIPLLWDVGKVGKWGVKGANALDVAGDAVRATGRLGDASELLGRARYLRHTDSAAFERGNRELGLRHVIGRHLTGTIPGSNTTLFPRYAKVSDISTAIGDVLRTGTRSVDEGTDQFVYTAVHPQFGNMKVVVDTLGRIRSAYPTP